jgi:hypothetical protein
MKQIKYVILILGLTLGFGLVAVPAYADTTYDPPDTTYDPLIVICSGGGANPSNPICKDYKNSENNFSNIVGQIVNALLYVLGAVSVIVIIIAGILFATSSGDPALITKSKNALLYAVVGLVVAIMAYAIVNYVIGVFA